MDPTRYILHADLDAFYASVEQRDDAGLRGRPVAVGGSPDGRGVVMAASYEARQYGVHSAMPTRQALRLCPLLVCVPPRFEKYTAVSRQIMAAFKAVTPLVEALSLDEAYLDITEQGAWDFAHAIGAELRRKVHQEAGIALTIGGGTSKTVAKTASRRGKPDGLLLVPPGQEAAFLAPLSIEMLWGVGPKTAELLRSYGVGTCAVLAASNPEWLTRTFGQRGREMQARAIGQDPSQVHPHRERRSVSAEETLEVDEGRPEPLRELVGQLAQRVAERLQDEQLAGSTVKVKLRLSDFTTFTRQLSLREPTDGENEIADAAWELVRREVRAERRFRLVGVGIANMREGRQLKLA